MANRRFERRSILPLLLGVLSCAPVPPPDYLDETATPTEPLYRDRHVLEIAWQIRDMSGQAAGEAAAREDRSGPDYGPLFFSTSLGLEVGYQVTVLGGRWHHEITMARPGEPLRDRVALTLFRFVTDLLGVSVEAVSLDRDEVFHLRFDLDLEDQTTLLDNAAAPLTDDEILKFWKEAVLRQISVQPVVINERREP